MTDGITLVQLLFVNEDIMTDWLEQSLIDIGLGYKESYDSYVSYGLTARSYTKQKYRKVLLLATSWKKIKERSL